VVTAPTFDLPDYSKIELDVPRRLVTDGDVDRALSTIAERYAEFDPVDGRPVAMEDFAVITYAAKLDGAPLGDAMPDAPKLLAGRENWWIHLSSDALAPGFSEALVGLSAGESRTFSIDLAQDFSFEGLRGKRLDYKVALHEIRLRRLPELDDALAERVDPGKTMEGLRVSVREELERFAKNEFDRAMRNGVVSYLLERVTCELPPKLVNDEMQGILRGIVEENQLRGVTDEELRSQEDQILGFAKQGATDRVRARFLLLKIAEKEKLSVAREELAVYVTQMAQRYEMPVQKLAKDLQRRNAFGPIQEQILVGKALDFLVSNVTVRVPASAPAAA